MIKICIFLLVLVTPNLAQKIINKNCQNYNVSKTTIDFDKLTNATWYEVKKYPNVFEQSKCQYDLFIKKTDGNFLNHLERNNSKIVSNSTSKITINGNIFTTQINSQTLNLTIIGTDYKTHLVMWQCTDLDGTKSAQSLWVLRRDKTKLNHTAVSDILKYTKIAEDNVKLEPANDPCNGNILTISILSLTILLFTRLL